MKKKITLQVYSFYRFKKIDDKKRIKKRIEDFIKNQSKILKGTILIANEGINGSISGQSSDLVIILSFVKKLLKIRKISLKVNNVNFLPFNRFKVRLKNEIVSLGLKNLNNNKKINNFIHPSNWDEFIRNDDVVVIDTRNMYEISIGKFRNSINPKTRNFREFPSKFKQLRINKKKRIAIYCTGGIRCEKASTYLKSLGYGNIFQLKGGILNYFENKNKVKNTFWDGACFVFDNRVAINKDLKVSNFVQCYGCRRPLSLVDTNSNKYVKGVCCHQCYNERTLDQKINSASRQKQIRIANQKKQDHPYKKIRINNFI